jgi:hypothetical protein
VAGLVRVTAVPATVGKPRGADQARLRGAWRHPPPPLPRPSRAPRRGQRRCRRRLWWSVARRRAARLTALLLLRRRPAAMCADLGGGSPESGHQRAATLVVMGGFAGLLEPILYICPRGVIAIARVLQLRIAACAPRRLLLHCCEASAVRQSRASVALLLPLHVKTSIQWPRDH